MRARTVCVQIVASTLSIAASSGQIQREANSASIAQDWEVFLGERDSAAHHVFRVAVCPDGSAYVSDGLGRLMRVDSNGRKTNDQRGIAPLVTTIALACDVKGRAVAGTSRSAGLTVLEPASDNSFMVKSTSKSKPLLVPFEILPLPSDAESGGEDVVLGISLDKR